MFYIQYVHDFKKSYVEKRIKRTEKNKKFIHH